MPASYTRYAVLIRAVVRALFAETANILDVGPGKGKYSDLLFKEYPNLDCVEVFGPYVKKFNLREKYRYVYVADIRAFILPRAYDLVILGDVLEHFSINEAQTVIRQLDKAGSSIIVTVPFLYEQGPAGGNPYERHLQADLTPEVMEARYPSLKPCVADQTMGVYLSRHRPW